MWSSMVAGMFKSEFTMLSYVGCAKSCRESKKVAAPHIRQEEATKYRCKECSKLFKAPEFVVKHVIVKHPELIGDKLDDVGGILQ